MAKCIMELERIKGIRQGSNNEKGINQHTIGHQENLNHQTTQKDLTKNTIVKKIKRTLTLAKKISVLTNNYKES